MQCYWYELSAYVVQGFRLRLMSCWNVTREERFLQFVLPCMSYLTSRPRDNAAKYCTNNSSRDCSDTR